MSIEAPRFPDMDDAIQRFRKQFNLLDNEPVDWLKLFAIVYNELNAHSWIPVTERLPKDGEDVLAWLEDEYESRMTAANYDRGVWYDCIMHHEEKRVKYWMKKPEPPKEEEDGKPI